jgi:predicted glycoside hydrolase/deacetylase ChbG (UPF0249 family)
VNADDFGLTSGVNRGIAEAHEHGIVTSASLMVRWPAATEAASYATRHPRLSLGLHVDLGEWAYYAGAWSATYEVVPMDCPPAMTEEVARQITTFQHLVGRPPTHIDSHQHVHREEPARSILRTAALRLRVPLRECTRGIRYRGDFYGQTAEGRPFPDGISLTNLLRILAELPTCITELGCHPGLGEDIPVAYGRERSAEVRVLCDARLRAALDQRRVELVNFESVEAGNNE